MVRVPSKAIIYWILQMSTNLHRQIKCFIVIGISATLLDFALYWWWHRYLTYSAAKALSFLCGSIFAYLLNKFVTFQQKQHSNVEVLKFATLYGSTLVANVAANSSSIAFCKFLFPTIWSNYAHLIILFSFILATGVSTVLNFIGQKFWVFKRIETIV